MIKVNAIPAFKDNYIWLIETSGHCYIIDPGDNLVVHQWLQKHDKTLSAILVTHHHNDHIGGINGLLDHYPIPVYGPDSHYIPQITHPLRDGDCLSLPGLYLQVMAIPGHTMDHIAYFAENKEQAPMLFCGDTLFAGGCGRIFDGTAGLLHQSLERLSQLPSSTQVFCAHEYTLDNLRFAQAVEPENKILKQRAVIERGKRSLGHATVPTTIANERATNPFLRCQVDSVRKKVGMHYNTEVSSTVEVFTLLRQWKDNFNL